MIIGRSTGNLIFIRSSIFILRGFTPLSFAFIIIYLLVPTRLEIPKYATIPFLIEVLFYLFVFLPRKYYLQLPAVHPALLYRHQRKALLLRAIRLVADRDVFLRKWFNDAPISEIKRENVKEFYRWAFLNSLHAHEDTEEEVEEAIVEMETHFGRNFQPGYGDAKCLRLSFDPVGMQHRPFLMYMGIMLIDVFTHLYLLIQGYQFYRSSISRSLNTFPPRPLTFLTKNKSPVSKLTYWYRPGTSVTKRPIVFLHGIGVGLGPYFKLLAQLTKEGGENDDTPQIIAIEILPISSRMVSHVSPMEEFCVEVEKILAFHGIADFCLVSHSYGSVLTSQLLKYDPVSTRIASVVLMDPVTILLLFPDVAYNFTRRKPNLANEHELYYFASQDMGVSHTLARHFFWYQNLVWKEDLVYRPEMYEGEGLRNRNVTVVLSGKDLIVNTQAVAAYLCCPDFPDWDNSEGCNWYLGVMDKPEQTNAWNSADGSMRVLWFGDLDHAQMLLKKEQSARVTREVLARASIKSGDVVNEGVNSF